MRLAILLLFLAWRVEGAILFPSGNTSTGASGVFINRSAGTGTNTTFYGVITITNQNGIILGAGRVTFVGTNAGNFTMTGADNVGVGYGALGANTTGNQNVAVGVNALQVNTTGFDSVAIGDDALVNNTTGFENTAIGYFAMGRNVVGDNNVAIGQTAMQFSTNGSSSVAIGSEALEHAFGPSECVAIGQNALNHLTNANQNTAVGGYTLQSLTNQPNNAAFGYNALTAVLGAGNTGIGAYAGVSASNAQTCLFLGNQADTTNPNVTNLVVIGANANGSVNNTTIIGGVGASATSVGIGTTTPAFTLDVVGAGQINNGLIVAGTGANGYPLFVTGAERITGDIGFNMPFNLSDGASGNHGMNVNVNSVDFFSGAQATPDFVISSTGVGARNTIAATNGFVLSQATTLVILTNVVYTNVTLNFPSTSAASFSDLLVNVANLKSNDVSTINVPAISQTNGVFTSWISNTFLYARFHNYAATAIDPASGIFNMTVQQFK